MNISPAEVLEARIKDQEHLRANYTRMLLENPENSSSKLAWITTLTGSLAVLYEIRNIPSEKWAQHAISKLIKASQMPSVHPSGVEIHMTCAMNDTWAWVAQGGLTNPAYTTPHRSLEEVKEMLHSFMKL